MQNCEDMERGNFSTDKLLERGLNEKELTVDLLKC